ncbi:hypothetical protein [Sphingobium boeckii]|uniref:Uncharacterized protein n=1 Tax=Sphingobium boeckii TaxID=1082345 RepID=A0A7W9AJG9_9SPHN|nr:hypothetical protein [Sphingobium boeckii]MBB5686790.1 hypothetical protein [Sphingobium boeckii]
MGGRKLRGFKLFLKRFMLLACLVAVAGCAYYKRAPMDLPPPPPRDNDSASEAAAAAYEAQQRAAQQAQTSARDREAAAARAAMEAEWARSRAGGKPASQTVATPERASPAPAVSAASAASPAAAPILCPALGAMASQTECDTYMALHAAMQSGVAAFDPPRAMKAGEQYPVKLVVGSDEVRAAVIDAATDAGQVKAVDVRLGAWVCAELLATQFDLSGPARQCRERGAARMLSWDWTVSPKHGGKLKLGVKIESFTAENGKPLDAIDSRMINVDVEAGAFEGLDKNVSGITKSMGGIRTMLLAILSAIGVLSVIIWRLRTLGQKPDKDALKDLTAT